MHYMQFAGLGAACIAREDEHPAMGCAIIGPMPDASTLVSGPNFSRRRTHEPSR
jgi:hypothetical protein